MSEITTDLSVEYTFANTSSISTITLYQEKDTVHTTLNLGY